MMERTIATATTIKMRYFRAKSTRRKSTSDRPATADSARSNPGAAGFRGWLGAGSMIFGIDRVITFDLRQFDNPEIEFKR
jgi:hypothetical protein